MKRLFLVLGILAALAIAALVAIPFLVDPNYFRPLLESQLSRALNREVKVGALALNLMGGEVTATEVIIGEDPRYGTEPFLRAGTFHASVALRPLLLSRELNITSVTVERPEIRMIMGPSGDWNFSSLGRGTDAAPPAPSAPSAPSKEVALQVRNVKIANGRFSLLRPEVKAQTFDDVDLDLDHLSTTQPVNFALSAQRQGGGSVRVEGAAGPLLNDALPPIEAKFSVPALDINAAGLVDRATGVAAVAELSGQVTTKGNTVDLNGDLRADKWRAVPQGSLVAQPVNVNFALSHDIARKAGRLRKADVRIGKATLTLAGSYSLQGKTPTMALKAKADRLPLTDLAAILPAFHVQLPQGASLESGVLSADATVAGALGVFSAVGPVSLSDVRLANFDLGTRLKVIQLLSGIPGTPTTHIESLATLVKHTPEGTVIEDLNMAVAGIGTLTGEGTIETDNTLDFRMRTTLRTSGALIRALGQKGDTTVPFLVSGTTVKPVFKPDVRTLTNEKVQQLTKDPLKTIEKAKDIFNLFRKRKEPEQPAR